jgi:lysophospholipase L1-like esterase
MLVISGIMLLEIKLAQAQVKISLDHSKIKYEGVLYPIITPNVVTFNRHTPAAYADPSSGIVYAPCNLTRATQSGVRIRFKTASPTIQLSFAAQTTPEGYFYNNVTTPPTDGFTVAVDGKVIKTFTNTLSFTINHPSPGNDKEFEINLPILWSVYFTGMQLESGYDLSEPTANKQLKYAAFGTSITMGTGQNNSSQTFAYQIAKAKNWDLHNFAVAGSSLGWQLAYDIKGKQFDVISIEQGFNNWASAYITSSLAEELSLYGRFIDSLRKFQPNARIYCISPIATTYSNPNPRYSLDDFRNGVCALVAARKSAGDRHIFCINGAEISDGNMLVDGIHLSISGAAKLASSLAPLMANPVGDNKGYIPANDPYFLYTGRFDFSNPRKPAFSYPGTSIKANFQGTSVAVIIKEYGSGTDQTTNYFNVSIDGAAPIVLKVNNKDTLYTISNTLSDTEHQIEIFKRTESSVGKCDFRGLKLADGKALLSPPDRNNLRIEFIGDSYSCGYGNEVNIPQTGNPNTGFHSINENNYNAWGAIATRTLQAEYVCTAASGRGMYRNNTGSTAGTLPVLYDQIIADQNLPAWDHNNYIPNILVIHLGTNDFFPVASGNAIDSAAFVSTYINFINKMRGYYPSACIICAVPNGLSDYYPAGKYNLTHAKNFIKAIVNYIHTQGDKKVYYFSMTPQGTKGEPYGEDYHPSLETHQLMADELVKFIETLTDCSSGATTEKTPKITFNDLVKTEGDGPFLLEASSSSTGKMNFSIISGSDYANVSNTGQVTILQPGVVMIKIIQEAGPGFKAGSASAKLTILSKTGKDTVAFTTNLALGNDGSWSTQTDALGSKVNSFTQTGPISVDFTQTAKTGTLWPWLALTKNVGKALTDVTFLKVTYHSNLPLQIALPQAPLSNTGESYATTIDASSSTTTVLIPITAFAQPTWATNKQALDLTKITSINFIPVITDPASGGNATIEIQSLVLYKSGLVSGITENIQHKTIDVISLNDSGIVVNVEEANTYSFNIYTINGNLITTVEEQLLDKGLHFVQFKNAQVNVQQVFILKISSKNKIQKSIKISGR